MSEPTTAPELTPDESQRVRVFGLETEDGAEAAAIVAMIDREVISHGRPMNGDGLPYGLLKMRGRIVRRWPEADTPEPVDYPR